MSEGDGHRPGGDRDGTASLYGVVNGDENGVDDKYEDSAEAGDCGLSLGNGVAGLFCFLEGRPGGLFCRRNELVASSICSVY